MKRDGRLCLRRYVAGVAENPCDAEGEGGRKERLETGTRAQACSGSGYGLEITGGASKGDPGPFGACAEVFVITCRLLYTASRSALKSRVA
jgi:hypothetical protein